MWTKKTGVQRPSILTQLSRVCDSGDDDDDYWMSVVITIIITAPPAHMSLLSNDRSSVPHWSNRHCWTFSDPSANYTRRTRKEPIIRERWGSFLSDRESSASLSVRHVLILLKKNLQNLKKWTRSSPVGQRHTSGLKEAFVSQLTALFLMVCCFYFCVVFFCPLAAHRLGYCRPGLLDVF